MDCCGEGLDSEWGCDTGGGIGAIDTRGEREMRRGGRDARDARDAINRVCTYKCLYALLSVRI